MIEIPKQLQDNRFRFIKLGKYRETDTPKQKEACKRPTELAWQKTNNYSYNDPELLQWLREGGNYGVIGRNGFLIIDTDEKETVEKLKEIPIKTFTVKTAKGLHSYFFTTDQIENMKFFEGEKDMGQIQADDRYAVAPNSIHPSGEKYEVVNDVAIAEITLPTIQLLFGDWLVQKEEVEAVVKEEKEYKGTGVPVEKIVDLTNFKHSGSEIIGTHPVHGSANKSNLKINTEKEVWRCFRCESGGGYLSLIGVVERIIKCRDCRPNRISKEQWVKIFDVARVKYGYADEAPVEEIIKKERGYILKTIMESPMPEIEYWMEGIMPKNTLVLIGGRPNSFKSMFTLALSLQTARNKRFLSYFYPAQNTPKILLYDLENGVRVIHRRTFYLCGVNTDGMENITIEDNFNKTNMKKELEFAMNYDVVILDSYRRFLRGEENASEITDEFYSKFLKPLREADKTVIIVHHFRKRRVEEEISEDDLLEMFRGSSDIVAQVDVAFGLFKTEEVYDRDKKERKLKVLVNIAKNRLGLPLQKFGIDVTQDDENRSTSMEWCIIKKSLTPEEERVELILSFIGNEEKARKDILNHVKYKMPKISIPTIDRTLKEMEDLGKITKTEHGVYKKGEF